MRTSSIGVRQTPGPVLVVRYAGRPDQDEFARYLRRYDELLESIGPRYATVFVTEPGTPMPRTKIARMQAEWIREHRQLVEQRCAGIGFVLPSSLMRGALRAIMTMAPLGASHGVFSEESDALAWARERLQEPPESG